MEEVETAVRLIDGYRSSTSSSTTDEESIGQTEDQNVSEGDDQRSNRFVPNPGRRPVLLDGPNPLSPTNSRDSITGRRDLGPGDFQYLVTRRSGKVILETLAVAPTQILNHVSAAELEDFESRAAKEERRRAIEIRNTRLKEAHTNTLYATSQSIRAGIMARRQPFAESSNDEMAAAKSAKKRTAEKSSVKSKSKAGRKRQKGSKSKLGISQSSSEEEFEVEAIIDHTEIRGKRSFLVKWVGYPDEENTWHTERDLMASASELVQEYLQRSNEKYEIERIVEHEIDTTGETWFKVQWEGYPGEDTWEPENELPEETVQEYYSSKDLISTFKQKTEIRPSSDDAS